VAGVSEAHPDLGPELRALAQSILDKLDPAIRLAAARAQGANGAPGLCQQVWCPVCALAALISGEQHPLLTIVADHSVALLTLIRAMVDDLDVPTGPPGPDAPPDPAPPDPGGPGGPPPTSPGRYQHIPVSVEE
jgi:hypothetical protein